MCELGYLKQNLGFAYKTSNLVQSHLYYYSVSKYFCPSFSFSLLNVDTRTPTNKFVMKKYENVMNIIKNAAYPGDALYSGIRFSPLILVE